MTDKRKLEHPKLQGFEENRRGHGIKQGSANNSLQAQSSHSPMSINKGLDFFKSLQMFFYFLISFFTMQHMGS